jgi:hypothetical protein
MQFINAQGQLVEGTVWSPGPLARSVWVLVDGKAVAVKLADKAHPMPYQLVERTEKEERVRRASHRTGNPAQDDRDKIKAARQAAEFLALAYQVSPELRRSRFGADAVRNSQEWLAAARLAAPLPRKDWEAALGNQHLLFEEAS